MLCVCVNGVFHSSVWSRSYFLIDLLFVCCLTFLLCRVFLSLSSNFLSPFPFHKLISSHPFPFFDITFFHQLSSPLLSLFSHSFNILFFFSVIITAFFFFSPSPSSSSSEPTLLPRSHHRVSAGRHFPHPPEQHPCPFHHPLLPLMVSLLCCIFELWTFFTHGLRTFP